MASPQYMTPRTCKLGIMSHSNGGFTLTIILRDEDPIETCAYSSHQASSKGPGRYIPAPESASAGHTKDCTSCDRRAGFSSCLAVDHETEQQKRSRLRTYLLCATRCRFSGIGSPSITKCILVGWSRGTSSSATGRHFGTFSH